MVETKLTSRNGRTGNILIRNLHSRHRIPLKHQEIKSLVKSVFKSENWNISDLSVNFVENRKIKEINRKYLKHTYPTDIITFDYNMGARRNGHGIDGELVISSDEIKKNARRFNATVKEETKRVIIHGCLHLAGYNDRTKAEKELIRSKENSYLRN